MRILGVTFLAVILLVLGFVGFMTCVEPALWPGQQKRESIRLLNAAKTPDELRKSVTSLGAFITPTNGGWIAIRYRDSHVLGPVSVAIARDSDGHWFQSEKHYCGTFRIVGQAMDREQRLRSESPELFTNETDAVYFKSGTPMEQFYRLFTATNLDTARMLLMAVGFKEFTP